MTAHLSVDAPRLVAQAAQVEEGDAMTRNVVNLDALLPREDLASPAEATADLPGLKITDLEPGITYSFLRKPDFQRETANWDPNQVADLIETFLRGDIIPSIILWQSGHRVFVIDGAHRLSALIAWVRDDYGAGKLSAELYENHIPEQQRALHEITRQLVKGRVGTYEDHLMAGRFPSSAHPDVLQRATQFPFRKIDIQWIRNASVDQARDAFFRINQGGTQIDPTETRILKANSSAVAISSRAISRGGRGHDYWKKYDAEVQAEIERIGGDLHRLLFVPPLNQPIKTLDVPVAGFGYGSHVLPFAFDVVTRLNDLGISDSTRRRVRNEKIADDDTGTETLAYLKRARQVIRFICSTDSSSLGLHPALYFYTPDGTFHAAALFNAVDWFMELASKEKLNDFLRARRTFEALILDHPVIVKPPSHKLGSGARTKSRMVALYSEILRLIQDGKTPAEIWGLLIKDADYAFLSTDDREQRDRAEAGAPGQRFATKAKTASFFAQALPAAPKCGLCGGLLHLNAMVTDHKEERSKGGSSASANGRMVHPVCNSNREQMGL